MTHSIRVIGFLIGLQLMAVGAFGQTVRDPLDVARETLKADRQEVVAAAMQLTDAEAKDFWLVYHQYRFAMDTVGDDLIKLVRDYAESYSDMSEDSARRLMKNYLDLEKKYLDTRTKYFKKFSDILPATKALRFVQVENRLDLVLRLHIAAGLPLINESN